MDGLPLRTENANKQLLASMNMRVMESQTFGRNDCLIDSILQSLQYSGSIHSEMTADYRNDIAHSVRLHLENIGVTTKDAFDYLSHDEHSLHIARPQTLANPMSETGLSHLETKSVTSFTSRNKVCHICRI